MRDFIARMIALLKAEQKKLPKPQEFVMYDSVNVDQIPKSARAVAGYVGGAWPTFSVLVRQFPGSHRLSIAISAVEDADCLDIEAGDAAAKDAPAWVWRQFGRGAKRPCVYASVSAMWGVWLRLKLARVKRKNIRIFTAHYTGIPHRCGLRCGLPTRADATQYTNRSLGRNLDASLCSPDFFS